MACETIYGMAFTLESELWTTVKFGYLDSRKMRSGFGDVLAQSFGKIWLW